MLLQKFLRDGGTIVQLTEKYAIKMMRHTQYNNLVLFKYNQIDSPLGEPLVQECRGVILDEANDWAVVSRPFDKFFNFGEGHASEIDWATAYVQEKADGSLATIYFYDNAWHIATSGSPDASGEVHGFGFTFSELFWKTFDSQLIVLPEIKDRHYCFMFELTSQYNKIVVRHTEPSIVLLGGRNITTGEEISARDALKLFPSGKLSSIKEFPLTSFEEIFATFPSISPLSQEGYVVVDANFNRVKCKSPAYVALHHMKDGLQSRRALVEVMRSGEIEEVVNYFPEYKEVLLEAKDRMDALVSELESTYDSIKDIQNQKEFALKACATKCSSALFSFRAKKTPSIRRYLADIHIDSAMGLLGYKTDNKD